MLVSSKELLLTAKQKHFAIPSANFVDEISAKAHIEVAEEMNLPLIYLLLRCIVNIKV